jgi:hypothetical protein
MYNKLYFFNLLYKLIYILYLIIDEYDIKCEKNFLIMFLYKLK